MMFKDNFFQSRRHFENLNEALLYQSFEISAPTRPGT